MYRTFTLTGEKLPGDYIKERLLVHPAGKGKLLKAKGIPYIKAEKVTKESYQKIQDIINKFLPTLPN